MFWESLISLQIKIVVLMEVIWCRSTSFIVTTIIINNTIIILIIILMTNIVSEPAYFLQRPEDTVAVAGSDLLLACQVKSMCNQCASTNIIIPLPISKSALILS